MQIHSYWLLPCSPVNYLSELFTKELCSETCIKEISLLTIVYFVAVCECVLELNDNTFRRQLFLFDLLVEGFYDFKSYKEFQNIQ